MADAPAIAGERSLIAARNIDHHQIGIVPVLVVVGLRDDDNDRLSVGRDLGIGDADDAPQIIELHSAWLLGLSGYGKKSDYDQARVQCGFSHKSPHPQQLYCVSPFLSIVSNSVESSVTLAITSTPDPGESLAVSSPFSSVDWE